MIPTLLQEIRGIARGTDSRERSAPGAFNIGYSVDGIGYRFKTVIKLTKSWSAFEL